MTLHKTLRIDHFLPILARLFILYITVMSGRAYAGGFEIPDNGTEALGRGGAFVAKADDGEALYYNVAGFARQRGTRLTIDSNFVIHDMAFTRDGVYSGDPSDARTPYAGTPYPTMRDSDRLFVAPNAVVSTDFGWFRRWTFAAGVYGPSSVGQHSYGSGDDLNAAGDIPPAQTTNGLPAPSRYDIARTNLLIVLPTLAVAFRAHRYIDVGFAWQMYYANFDLASANFTPLGKTNCPTPDYAGCDSYGHVRTSGTSFSSSSSQFGGSGFDYSPSITSFGWVFSALAHPTPFLDLGFILRTPINIHSEGTLHPQSPPNQVKLGDAPALFSTEIPLFLRLGGRYVKRYADGTERADVELDFVFENWATEVADHVHASGDSLILQQGNTLDVDVTHNYKNTYGVRLGGAYNYKLGERSRLIGRAGIYYDSAATDNKGTRLDINSFDKLGLTLGLGLKYRGVTLNVAYAYVYSPSRTVTDSEITAVSATNGTNYAPNDPRIIIGNGLYQPTLHILSIGLTFNFSELKAPHLMPN